MLKSLTTSPRGSLRSAAPPVLAGYQPSRFSNISFTHFWTPTDRYVLQNGSALQICIGSCFLKMDYGNKVCYLPSHIWLADSLNDSWLLSCETTNLIWPFWTYIWASKTWEILSWRMVVTRISILWNTWAVPGTIFTDWAQFSLKAEIWCTSKLTVSISSRMRYLIWHSHPNPSQCFSSTHDSFASHCLLKSPATKYPTFRQCLGISKFMKFWGTHLMSWIWSVSVAALFPIHHFIWQYYLVKQQHAGYME